MLGNRPDFPRKICHHLQMFHSVEMSFSRNARQRIDQKKLNLLMQRPHYKKDVLLCCYLRMFRINRVFRGDFTSKCFGTLKAELERLSPGPPGTCVERWRRLQKEYRCLHCFSERSPDSHSAIPKMRGQDLGAP